MTKMVNLTPHDIKIYTKDKGAILEVVPKSGYVARVDVSYGRIGTLFVKDYIQEPSLYWEEDIPIELVSADYGEVVGLPDPEPGVYYIVSALVLSALRESGSTRRDVIAPDTGPTAVRDEKGNVIGVTRFIGLK